MSEINKENRISEELKRISQYFEKVDANQRAIVSPLLQNAAFMKVTLEDLQEVIKKEGVTEEYQNGANQRGVKQSAALQSYNSLIKNYASVIKTLSQLLPPEAKKIASSTFFGWNPPEKSEEEIEEEIRMSMERQKKINAEIAKGIEYQRQQRESMRTVK